MGNRLETGLQPKLKLGYLNAHHLANKMDILQLEQVQGL